MLNTELREGKQHCQKGTPEFLEHILTLLAQLDITKPVLFRFDGGSDSKDILKILEISGHFYIVKRNLRKEHIEYWHDVAQAEGEITYQDEAKTVYTGIHTGKKHAGDASLPDIDIIFQVTETRITKEGTPYKTDSKRKRLRKVIDDLIRVAVKIVTHARQICIRLWEKDPWLACFKQVYSVCCNL